MKTQNHKYLLQNWLFIIGLALLFLNDHYLKWHISNWLTGKLSDFVGLLIFPMFIKFIFPKAKTHTIVIICGLFFVFWKLPISEDFIKIYNQISIIPITRVVDYSDLLALTILPLSNFFISNIERYRITNKVKFSLNPIFILIPSCLIFMATSPPIRYNMKPSGDIHIGKSYQIKSSKEAILNKLKDDGFSVRKDTSKNNLGRADYYLIENIILNKGKDTIKTIELGFMGNLLLVNNVSLSGNFNTSDWKELKKYSKHYKKLIETEIIEEIK